MIEKNHLSKMNKKKPKEMQTWRIRTRRGNHISKEYSSKENIHTEWGTECYCVCYTWTESRTCQCTSLWWL